MKFNQPHRPFDDDYPSDYVPSMETESEFNQMTSPVLGSRKQSFSMSVLSDVMKSPTFSNTNELINHVSTCSNYLCPYEQCQELKLQCFHYALCDRKDCKICNHITEMLMEHKRACNPTQCFFILCRNTILTKMNDMAPPRNNPNGGGGGGSKSRHSNHSSSHHSSHSKQNQQNQQALLQAQHSTNNNNNNNNNNISPSININNNINVKSENKKFNNNSNTQSSSSTSSSSSTPLIMIQPTNNNNNNNNNPSTPSALMLNTLTISTPTSNNNNNINITIHPTNNNNNNIPIQNQQSNNNNNNNIQPIVVKQQQHNNNNIKNNNVNNNISTNGILWSTMLIQPDPTNKGKICKHTPRKLIKGQSQSQSQSQQPVYVQWVRCCLCNKLRKLPGHMEISRLREFKCNMNIWDPPYADCIVPEEEDKENTTIDLQGNYVEYEQEKEAFMEKLKQFHRESGSGVVLRTPTLGRKEVDLYRLFREVSSYGGACSVVSKEGTWARIYRGMDNFSPTETSASFRLKKMYNKYLLAFEKYVFNFDDTLPPTTTNNNNNNSNNNNNMIDNSKQQQQQQQQWGNSSNTKYTYYPAVSADNNNNKSNMNMMNNNNSNKNAWVCSDCGTKNTTTQFCTNCQSSRKKRKTSNEAKYNSNNNNNNNEMKPPPHLINNFPIQQQQQQQSPPPPPPPSLNNNNNNNTYTATVSLSQQQSLLNNNNNNNNISTPSFMNSLLQPPSIPPPSSSNNNNQLTQSSSSSSLTSLSSSNDNNNNNNNNGGNNSSGSGSSQLPPRKESINILFTRKESYYTLPADGSTPLLNVNNSPPSQSISPSSTYINSSNYSSVRRDSFNLPELSLGPAATDMDVFLRNTDLHNEH